MPSRTGFFLSQEMNSPYVIKIFLSIEINYLNKKNLIEYEDLGQ